MKSRVGKDLQHYYLVWLSQFIDKYSKGKARIRICDF